MIRRLDARLIAAHQWVVDITQCSPAWYGQQCAIAIGVLVVVRAALFDLVNWVLPLLLLLVGLLWVVARAPTLYASIISGWTRAWFIACLLVRFVAAAALVAYGQPLAPFGLISLLIEAGSTAYAYFAACRPPRPRVPRTSPRLARGGAS